MNLIKPMNPPSPIEGVKIRGVRWNDLSPEVFDISPAKVKIASR